MLHGDYYTLLGISRVATGDEIKQAYRGLVRKWHPDLNPDLAGAEERLKRLNEAYRVLREPGSRRNYDRMVFARLAACCSRNVPVNIPRTVRDRRRGALVPLLISALAALLLIAVGLAYRSPSILPEEWRMHARYASDEVLSRRVTLSAEETEIGYRAAARYWERELEILPAAGLAEYNLATVYSHLAGLAERRGDHEMAKHYNAAARKLMWLHAYVDSPSAQISKS